MTGGDTAKSKQQNKLDEYVDDLLHRGKYGFPWSDFRIDLINVCRKL